MHTVSKITLAVVLALSTSLWAQEKLVCPQSIDAMAYTEDGQHLVLSHRTENLVSIVSLKGFKIIHQYTVPSAGAILCRGERIYVANAYEGAVTVLSEKQQFRPVDQLEVGDKHVTSLAAPSGAYFAGTILAGCRVARTDGEAALAVYAVDVQQDRYRLLLDKVFAPDVTVDAAGRYVSCSAVYDYRAALERRWLPYSMQVAAPGARLGRFVQTRHGLSTGLDHGGGRSGDFIEDATQAVAYQLTYERSKATVRPFGGPLLVPLADASVTLPQELGQPPLAAAATVGEKTHLVLRSGRTLVHVEIPSAKTDPSKPVVRAGDVIAPFGSMWQSCLFVSLDGKKVFWHSMDLLMQIDPTTGDVVAAGQLPGSYARVAERPDYLVGIGISYVDLLNKQDLSVKKRIPLPQPMPGSLVLDDQQAVSYVSIPVQHEQNPTMVRMALAIVDESTGKVRVESTMRADWVAKLPGKSQLLTIGYGRNSPVKEWPAREGYMSGGWEWQMARYELTGQMKRVDPPSKPSQDDQPLPLRRPLLSNDGKLLVWSVSSGTKSDAQGEHKRWIIRMVSPDDVGKVTQTIDVPDEGSDEPSVVFSHSGRHALVFNRQFVYLVDIQTNRVLKDALALEGGNETRVQAACFTADGKRVILLCQRSESKDPAENGWLIKSLPIKLP